MASDEILFKRSVARDLRSMPKQDVQRRLGTIDKLATDPLAQGCKKISGQNYDRVRQYQVNQGDFRVIYEVLNDVLAIHMVRVAHRPVAYRFSYHLLLWPGGLICDKLIFSNLACEPGCSLALIALRAVQRFRRTRLLVARELVTHHGVQLS